MLKVHHWNSKASATSARSEMPRDGSRIRRGACKRDAITDWQETETKHSGPPGRPPKRNAKVERHTRTYWITHRAGSYKEKKKKKKKSIRGTALIRRAMREQRRVSKHGICNGMQDTERAKCMMQEEIEKNNKRTEIATRRYEKIAKSIHKNRYRMFVQRSGKYGEMCEYIYS